MGNSEKTINIRRLSPGWSDFDRYLTGINLRAPKAADGTEPSDAVISQYQLLNEQRQIILSKLPHYALVFKHIDESNSADAARLSGARPVGAIQEEDSYPEHGMRVARNIIERLGIVDETAFLAGLFHDYGNENIRNVVNHNIRTQVKDEKVTGEVMESILAYTGLDEKNIKVTDRIFTELQDLYPFGQEFSPEQITALKADILKRYTNKPGTFDEDKYDSLSDALAAVSSDKRLSKSEITAHIAYLAASIDNIEHPKPGRTRADLQRVALSLSRYLPLYWSISDHFAHEAEDAINKAFHPEAYANLQNTWNQIEGMEDGHFMENQIAIGTEFLNSFKRQIIQYMPDAEFITEAEMNKREAKFREMDPKEVDMRREMILKENEIYLAQLDTKTMPAIFRKASKQWVDRAGKKKLREDIVQPGFGTPEFWKNYIINSHDLLRTRVIMGAQAALELDPMITDIEKWKDATDKGKKVEISPEEMDAVWFIRQNNARTVFEFDDPADFKKEIFEIKNFADNDLDIEKVEGPNGTETKIDHTDRRRWFYHLVLRSPVVGAELNVEIHAGLSDAYFAGYVGPSDLLHVNYKVYDDIANMIVTSPDETDIPDKLKAAEMKRAYMQDIAKMANKMKNKFLQAFHPVHPQVLKKAA